MTAPHPTTELAAAVRTATEAARRLGTPRPRRPWCAPLPPTVAIDGIGDALVGAKRDTATSPVGVVIGLVDRPDDQRIDPLTIDLHGRGGVLVVGAGGSGRSTALRTLAGEFALESTHRVHAIDTTGALAHLGRHGVDVVALADVERTLRLLRRLADRERARSELDTLLVIDGWATVSEHHERINRGEAVELLARIAATAGTSGVRLAVSATTPIELPLAIGASFGHQLALRCASPDDAHALGLPVELADARTPPGRGWFDGQLIQIAPPRPVGRIVTCSYATPALPPAIPLGDLATGSRWCWPVGRRADDLGVASVDLGAGHLLVLGPPRSGRTTALHSIAVQARRSDAATVVVTVDGRDPDRERSAATTRSVLELAAGGGALGEPGVLLVIDDVCDLLDDDLALDQQLATVLRRPGRIRVVASAEIDGIGRSFADSPRLLRIGRRGVLLQPDPDLHPPILHTSLPRRDDLPAGPGRGWIVGDGPPVAMQFALR